MGTRIGTIHANVTAKDLSWSDTMRRVREETKRTADLLQGISDRGGGLGSLGGIMPTIDIGNVINRSIGLVTDAYRQLSEAREKAEIKADKADVLGLSMADLQGLSVGAALANTDIETVTGATDKFIKKLAEAAQGSKEVKADLALLGLTIQNFSGLSTADALRLVADRLQTITDVGTRASVAASLFGREAGLKMVTVLKGGSSAIDEYIRQARELGIVLSDAEIASMRFANTQADINKLLAESTGEKMSLRFGPEMASVEQGKGLFKKILQGASDAYGMSVELLAAAGAKATVGGDLTAIFAEGLKRRGILPMTQSGTPNTAGPVVSGAITSPELTALSKEVDEWDMRLAENFRIQAEKMDKIIEERWQEWVGPIENPGYLPLPGGGILDMTDQIEALKRQTEEQQKDQERSMQRQAEELARQQMQMESASSGRGGVAAFKGSEDARRLMDASKQYQSQMAGIKRESAAERMVKENRRMEQLTQQMLQELRSIKTNTASTMQALGV